MRRGQVAQATPAGGEKGSADREPRTAQAGPRRCSCSGQTRGGASASTLRARPARQLPPRPHGGPSERRALLAEAGTLLPLARRRERRGKGRAVHRRKGARRRRVHEGRHAGGRRQEPRRPRASAPPADRHEHDGLPEISDIEKLMFLNERNNDLPPCQATEAWPRVEDHWRLGTSRTCTHAQTTSGPRDAPTILPSLARRVRRGSAASAAASLLSILCAAPAAAFSPGAGALREAAPGASFLAARLRALPARIGPGAPGGAAGQRRLRLRGGGAPTAPRAMAEPAGMRLIDTCVNLQDAMFQGIYNDKQVGPRLRACACRRTVLRVLACGTREVRAEEARARLRATMQGPAADPWCALLRQHAEARSRLGAHRGARNRGRRGEDDRGLWVLGGLTAVCGGGKGDGQHLRHCRRASHSLRRIRRERRPRRTPPSPPCAGTPVAAAAALAIRAS